MLKVNALVLVYRGPAWWVNWWVMGRKAWHAWTLDNEHADMQERTYLYFLK